MFSAPNIGSLGHEVKPCCKDGWMTCDFTSFSTVFLSYKDDGKLIMNGCVQWNSVYGLEDLASRRYQPRSARSEGQRLTNRATGAPTLLEFLS